MKKVNLKISGMHCSSCAMLISDALADVGVKSKIDVEKEKAEIEFDENKVTLDKIKKIIIKEGYKLE